MSDADFSLKEIAIPAFGPTLLFGVANGAILPVIALSAIDLDASPAVSGLIVALIGFGSLISNIPAAMITSRVGERRALVGASVLSIFAMMLCLTAGHEAVLALGVLLMGATTSVFNLARQTYLIEAVPLYMRARAMSTLGGTSRIGMFFGPFAAAGLMHFVGLAGAYWIAIVALVAAGALSFAIPELELRNKTDAVPVAKPKMIHIARSHKTVLLALGSGILLIGAMRASRQIAIPLWADHIGLSPTTTAIVFGLVSAIDMLVFYPAGKVMDQRGRLWVALPCTVIMGLSFLLMPLTSQLTSFVVVSMLLGFGNGLGSGIIMTLGADASPKVGRTEFLGIWRLIADVGTSVGPFVLSGITALISLGAGIGLVGMFGFAAAAVFWCKLPHTRVGKSG